MPERLSLRKRTELLARAGLIWVHNRSIIVNHLQKTFEGDDKIAVLCIYCNYKEQSEQTVTNLIASLLKQIVQDLGSTLDNVTPLYTHNKGQCTRPTLDELTKVLETEFGTYSKVFIVVDALDECREEDGTRERLLKALRSLTGNVNLMVTSRNLPSIAREFEGKKQLTIRANDQDIKIYINGRIAVAPRHLKNLQDVIVNRIVESINGR